jgi:predicted AAA+ superfamily ATPase
LGPRRVGKTTGIKLLIKSLIESGEKPENIVYVNVDLIPELKYFQEILDYTSEKGFKFIFIDEATSLENWWRPLKGFIDSGSFKNSIITVSGSLSLKKHAELFPGRTGLGKKIEVLPLSFQEYFKIFGLKEKESEIVKIFEKYLLTGGFLGALDNPNFFISEIIDSLESEILKLGLSNKLTFEIFSSILTKIPSALSYQTIASDLGIDYKTVRSYLETFENMYLIKIAYCKENGKIRFKKEKKIFFRDPFLLSSISSWTSTKFLESAIYEHVVQEHLFRKFSEIYYYKNKYEIDCISNGLRIEVKAKKPHRKYPENVKILDEKDIPIFLMNL